MLSRAQFDNLAQIHDRNAIAHVTDDRDVVRDQDIRQIVLLLQFHQQVQNLRLDRNIQCRGRFIQHNDVGLGGQCPGDGNALTLTAGKRMRWTVQVFRANPHLTGQGFSQGASRFF